MEETVLINATKPLLVTFSGTEYSLSGEIEVSKELAAYLKETHFDTVLILDYAGLLTS